MFPDKPIRVAHFSDLHITTLPIRMALTDWFGKRFAGWLTSKISRGRAFRDALKITAALGKELQQRQLDFTVFSGDAAVLGMTEEYDLISEVMAPMASLPGITVPGNHDHYTYQTVRRKLFEHTFPHWLEGERIGDHQYPFARNVGGYWFIAVNSSVPNVILIDSRGGVGWQQRKRLEELLKRLPPGPRILVTHYPLVLANGRSEKRWRRMRDARKVRTIAANNGICLWLHGHRHSTYFRPAEKRRPFPTACPGSVTQYQRWTYHEYTFNGPELEILRRIWVPEEEKFVDRDKFTVPLRVMAAA